MVGVLQSGEIELEVPPLAQHQVHSAVQGDENRACWFVAAQMLLAYRGPTQPLEMTNVASLLRLWKNHGIQPDDLDRLAHEAGLELTTTRALFRWMGAAEWYAALSALGPLMVVVGKHVVVVRGIVNQGGAWLIVLNDPWTGASHREALQHFNGRVERHLPILYRRSPHRAPMIFERPIAEPFRMTY